MCGFVGKCLQGTDELGEIILEPLNLFPVLPPTANRVVGAQGNNRDVRLKLLDLLEAVPNVGPTCLDQRCPADSEVAHFIVVAQELLQASRVGLGPGVHTCTGGDTVTQASHTNRFRFGDRHRGHRNGE